MLSVLLSIALAAGTVFNSSATNDPTYTFQESSSAKATIRVGGFYCPAAYASGSFPGTCTDGSVGFDSTVHALRYCYSNTWYLMLSSQGIVSIANGGTNSSATPTTGGVGYGTGTAHAYTAAGSATTVLHGGASAPAFSAVELNNDTTGSSALGYGKGGTASSATPTAGGAAYGTGSAYALTGAGTAGQKLMSNGASAPTWSDAPSAYFTNTTINNSSTTTPSTVLSWSVPARVSYFQCVIGVLGTATASPRFAFVTPGAATAQVWSKFMTSATSPTYENLRVSSGTYTTGCTSSCITSYAFWTVSGYTWSTAGTFTLQVESSTSGQTVSIDGAACYIY